MKMISDNHNGYLGMTHEPAVRPYWIDQYKAEGLNSHPDKIYSSRLQYVVGMARNQLLAHLVWKMSETYLSFRGDCDDKNYFLFFMNPMLLPGISKTNKTLGQEKIFLFSNLPLLLLKVKSNLAIYSKCYFMAAVCQYYSYMTFVLSIWCVHE